jgi:anti-sigma factor RsiW
MTTPRPISEEDLHAYVDRRLDTARQAEVEAYLAGHPDEAARIAGYVRERAALRAALAPIAEEPIPSELSLARLIEARRRPGLGPWRAAAAAVALLALGGAGGWLLPHPAGPAPSEASFGGIASLAEEAANSYAVYAPDHIRPVELRAADRSELVHWVSERLQRSVAVPELAGYRFMGGRLVPTPHGPAALFLYDDDHGTRLALLVRPMAVDRDAPMAEHSQGAISGFAWSRAGLGYSLVTTGPARALQPLADDARRQTES